MCSSDLGIEPAELAGLGTVGRILPPARAQVCHPRSVQGEEKRRRRPAGSTAGAEMANAAVFPLAHRLAVAAIRAVSPHARNRSPAEAWSRRQQDGKGQSALNRPDVPGQQLDNPCEVGGVAGGCHPLLVDRHRSAQHQLS